MLIVAIRLHYWFAESLSLQGTNTVSVLPCHPNAIRAIICESTLILEIVLELKAADKLNRFSSTRAKSCGFLHLMFAFSYCHLHSISILLKFSLFWSATVYVALFALSTLKLLAANSKPVHCASHH